MLGCYVDRRVGVIKLIESAPHINSLNKSRSFYVSHNSCSIENDEGFFPTIAVAEGTQDNGTIEVGVARFVTGFDQAMDLFREMYWSG